MGWDGCHLHPPVYDYLDKKYKLYLLSSEYIKLCIWHLSQWTNIFIIINAQFIILLKHSFKFEFNTFLIFQTCPPTLNVCPILAPHRDISRPFPAPSLDLFSVA